MDNNKKQVFMDNTNNPYSRKKEPELNKQLIIDAATEIGSETDWHQVTFQAIADKTGLSKGGIIHHFRNKEELLDELMSRSLSELKSWLEQYKAENGEKDGELGYLKSVFEQRNDARYAKTMRIVLQAIMINPKYTEQWLDWYNENILPSDSEELSVKSLIIILIADGIWYNENMGGKKLNNDEKEKLFEYLKHLK